MTACRSCLSEETFVLLDCGALPLCNRYLSCAQDGEYEHRLILGSCGRCGLVQLLNDPVPVEEMSPRYSWLTYREPEEHLDRLAARLAELPGIDKNSIYCGISYKDDSLLERMRARGFHKSRRIDPEKDLGISTAGAGVEAVQDRLDPARCAGMAEHYGRADVVMARHILEHSYGAPRMMKALRELLRPGGFLVLEVPDCAQALETRDYSTLWEEHTLYFTPETFKGFCASVGLELLAFEVVSYALENSLVAIARFDRRPNGASLGPKLLEREKNRALEFGGDFAGWREQWRRRLADFRRNHGKVALLGAGHLSCMFLNLFGLKDYIEFVADDDRNKQGLLMPGSRLPIRGSADLIKEEIRLCLLGVNPQVEEILVQRQARFLESGGRLASIFGASKRALLV